MSLLLLSTHFVPASGALAAAPISVAFAEQPVRLLRDKGFYLAGRGARLQNGDIVETGPAVIQIDGGGASTLALAPASRLHVRILANGTDYVLLGGWMKVQARPGQDGAASLDSSGVRITLGESSVILHASPGKTELFVESGEPAVEELQAGKVPGSRRTVGREQYAVRIGSQPLKVAQRAPKDFLAALPPAFFDALVPVSAKAAVSQPRLERAATYAEIAPWLSDQPELRQAIHRRFYPPKPAQATPSRRPVPALAKDPS